MKLYLPSYSQGRHFVSEVLEPSELSIDTSLFLKSVHVQIQLDRNDPYLRLNYQISAFVHLICDRCLEDYEQPLSAEGMLIFVLGGNAHEDNPDEDEIRYLSADTVEIDLSMDLYDILMLSLPLKSLCKDDCKGLCSNCGCNLNEDTCDCHIVTNP
ncbi:DUF177 domain-containing protein [bacterium]|nr:DUF177 domain-containing protein [bacterium]